MSRRNEAVYVLGGAQGGFACNRFREGLPINPSNGPIGRGHPVGATGVRILPDGYRQVTGRAGDYHIEDACKAGPLVIDGSATTPAAFVVGAGQ